MATQKPISTISYNSEAFLREKLEAWLDAHIIQAYQFICHKGEDGDKDHIHLRLEPNKRVDPMDLKEELKEFRLGEEKPLGVRPFRPSKEEDWFLYVVHDKDYLKLKYGGGEKGEKIPYKWQEIRVPEDYDVEIAFIRAKAKLEHTTSNIATRIQSGENSLNMILEGENPYIVNAIMRAVNTTDYERLHKAYDDLDKRFFRLIEAVNNYGLSIQVDEEDNIVLIPEGEL